MINAYAPSLSQIEKNVFGGIARHGNFFLVLGVGLVLAMMMLPLPPAFLDLLLALNIMGSLTLLLVAISVNHSLQIATFPTLLLMATLFRLGLNISSTRLILTEGYAGHIIETFGSFATGGNLMVGSIMFLILTIIQFIVIAKGSERVAEVAARFSLDAMPGKQMSIDADLRAGMIHSREAKEQREDLQRESKMYGSMDGAMKFVKGDAIAGVIITMINLLGGLFSGVTQKGLSLPEAIERYSTLTIGDGLVSQIPALLISITAGMIVTRVAHTHSENSLGKDIGLQIFSQPKALLAASGLALLLGFVPGFPLILFLLVSIAFAGVAFYLIQSVRRKAAEPTPVADFVVREDERIAKDFGKAIPLVLEVGPELYRIFQEDPRWTHCFGKLFPRLSLHLSNRIGIIFPELKLAINSGMTKTFCYQIRIYEVPIDHGILTPEHCTSLKKNKPLPESVEPPDLTTETVHGTPIQLWDLHEKQSLSEKGLSTYGPEEMLLRHLARVLKRHAGDFVGIQEVHDLLNRVELHYPELVREVVPKMISVQKLTEIIKRLVEEDVPIKDFRLILQTLSCSDPESKDPITLTEQVRIGLRRTLTFMHTVEGNRLPVFTINPDIEDEIRGGIRKSGSECYLVLAPDRLKTLAQTFKDCIARSRAPSKKTVILTQMEIRRYVRKLTEQDLPEQTVLSFEELDPKVVISPIGTITPADEYEDLTVVG